LEKSWLTSYDEAVAESIDVPDLNLYQMFEMAVEENPGGTATIFFGARIRYRQLKEAADRLAAVLSGMGIRKGDRVSLLLPNLPGYPIAHFAAAKIGAVLVPTNPLYVERELQLQLNDADAEIVITVDQLYPKLAGIRNETGVRRVIVMSIGDFLPRLLSFAYRLKERSEVPEDRVAGIFRYSRLMKKKPARSAETFVAPGETAMLLYTGGTTGISKGAELTHRNVVYNAYQTRHWLWSLKEKEETILCVLPFFHSYGMTTGLHLAVTLQSAMLLLPRFDLADVAKNIKKYRPTVFCAVPSMYNAINRSPKLTPQDVSSIRLCVSGGAALPAEVQNRFEERTGGRLVEGYGLTETSPVALVNPTHGHRKNGTIGVPISDTLARIVDLKTRETLPPGEIGELAIKGPQVMKGYWNRPMETSEVLVDGWLFTGDMAVMDEEGFFRIVDRKKDVIISAGMNIYPREIEEVLHQHPKIVEAAVVGVPSTVREEVVKAYLVLEKGESLTKKELVEFCLDKLSKYKFPKRIEIVDELPKSAMGKILKRELKQKSEF